MKKRLAQLIGRWPALYRLASRIYWTLKPERLSEFFIGTKAREKTWAERSIGVGYWDNRDHTSKPFIIEKIAAYAPISSVLEVGCASGPNLYLLAKRLPQAQLLGVDINAEAVAYGNTRFMKEGIANVRLETGRADELGRFEDAAFDVVFTNALLIYIGSDKIREVVTDLVRVARRALLLVELHLFEAERKDPFGLGRYQQGNWVRDYVKLLRQFVPEERIKVTRIPEDVWPVQPWSQYGAVVEAIHQPCDDQLRHHRYDSSAYGLPFI